MKSIGGLASLGLISFIVFGWTDSDRLHVPAKLVMSNSLAFPVEKHFSSGAQQVAIPAMKADVPEVARAPSLNNVLATPSVSLTAAFLIPAVGSVAYEQMSKRDLYGQKVVAETLVAVDRPPARDSAELAAAMAVKNGEMNALHGRQAAQARLQPEVPLIQEPSNHKAPI